MNIPQALLVFPILAQVASPDSAWLGPAIGIGILCAVAAGIIGARKGELVQGLLIGFFCGPLGVLLAILSKGRRVGCPYCRELIHPKAKVCPHCQRDLAATAKN